MRCEIMDLLSVREIEINYVINHLDPNGNGFHFLLKHFSGFIFWVLYHIIIPKVPVKYKIILTQINTKIQHH